LRDVPQKQKKKFFLMFHLGFSFIYLFIFFIEKST